MKNAKYILFFDQIKKESIPLVGGKNAALGEMYNQLTSNGIQIPYGFAITTSAYHYFCNVNNIKVDLDKLISEINTTTFENLFEIGQKARALIRSKPIPKEIVSEIQLAYFELSSICTTENCDVAVRSSATSEDLPSASFAGQMQSFLNITGEIQLLEAVKECLASLFTDRAIKYRFDMNFDKLDIAISIGVQQMVRSDLASSGVAFTIDPDTGFENTLIINGIWGLGENCVQGTVIPDEWVVFKPTLKNNNWNPILKKKLGTKELTMVYSDRLSKKDLSNTTINIRTEKEKKVQYSLSDAEVVQLSKWGILIEQLYHCPMDIEWAKDGITQRLYIVQARPETVHSKHNRKIKNGYKLLKKGTVITTGIALGDQITSGKARIIRSPKEAHLLKSGEILVTDSTNPDWDPILKKAAGIITNKGGRTSHAAIVARELGTVAIVGTQNATEKITNGQEITLSCAEGKIGIAYDGLLSWEITPLDFSDQELPQTKPMLLLADPEKAFDYCEYPNEGVGLMRIEFVVSNTIKIHPLALCEPEKIKDESIKNKILELTKGYDDPRNYFVNTLAESVALVAAAFYPKDVIVRMSDFKTNEYANLIGGNYFEPKEENPMLGFRGASRYYNPLYQKGFALECEAMKKVRNEMGLLNVKLMIPFCRTIEEGEKVIEEMRSNGLVQGENGLEIYVMIELPSNVLLADQFAQLFDGFSIGSNDLTQLTLGIDRDSALVNPIFNEENQAVKQLIHQTILVAKRNGIKVGICGQAPSDIPGYISFLTEEGIDSISFNPDALLKGIELLLDAEKVLL